MASYQDIDARLGEVERKVDFIMRSFTMTKLTPTGIVGEDGKEAVRAKQMTLLDIYREVATTGAATSPLGTDHE